MGVREGDGGVCGGCCCECGVERAYHSGDWGHAVKRGLCAVCAVRVVTRAVVWVTWAWSCISLLWKGLGKIFYLGMLGFKSMTGLIMARAAASPELYSLRHLSLRRHAPFRLILRLSTYCILHDLTVRYMEQSPYSERGQQPSARAECSSAFGQVWAWKLGASVRVDMKTSNQTFPLSFTFLSLLHLFKLAPCPA